MDLAADVLGQLDPHSNVWGCSTAPLWVPGVGLSSPEDRARLYSCPMSRDPAATVPWTSGGYFFSEEGAQTMPGDSNGHPVTTVGPGIIVIQVAKPQPVCVLSILNGHLSCVRINWLISQSAFQLQSAVKSP